MPNTAATAGRHRSRLQNAQPIFRGRGCQAEDQREAAPRGRCFSSLLLRHGPTGTNVKFGTGVIAPTVAVTSMLSCVT